MTDDKVMVRLSRVLLALALVAVPAMVGTSAGTPPVEAASAPWRLPTAPPKCTTAQADSGNVANCIMASKPGMPESRGWPKPPFPEPDGQTVAPWQVLTLGSSGPTVGKVQMALDAAGAEIGVDGKYGNATFHAVQDFQQAHQLTVTGNVNAATAKALGVQRMTGGTFPPKGWVWLGWGYNGSPALAAWEKLLVGNPKQIGFLKPGALKALPDALPLFTGFYAEIQARGYVVHDGGPYVFRCTASTRKDCAGLWRYALSNHAYGLAQDINTSANPMKRYVSSGGTSACAVPMVTDMPRWVIQTAEKWGLYWGGYAWSSGCPSPSTWRSSVTRDPMHFEFNGTTAQAKAILAYNTNAMCVPVVDSHVVEGTLCTPPGEVPPARTRLAVTLPRPAGATAAMVAVTTRDATEAGWFTAENCVTRSIGPRPWTNGSVRVGRVSTFTAIVPLDTQGRFCLYQSAPFNTSVDVLAYFAPVASAPSGYVYVPVSTRHTVDTAASTFCSSDSTCWPAGKAPASSVVMSLTPTPMNPVATWANLGVSGASVSGGLAANTCDALTGGAPKRSAFWFSSKDAGTVAAAVVPTVTTDLGTQFCTWSASQVHRTVDVVGFFAPVASGGFAYTPKTPTRVIDTHGCWTDPLTAVERCSRRLSAGAVVRMTAPAGAKVVLVNITTSEPTAPGTVVAASCTAIAEHRPTSVAVRAGMLGDTANIAAVPVDANGRYCLWVTSSMHVTVDLFGTFSASGALRYLPTTPTRVLSTRPRG